MATRTFGLIGYPIGHSFSQKYFSEKFARENLPGHQYHLFEIPDIKDFPDLVASQPGLVGLNVTLPYKQQVIPYLDGLEENAEAIGAVNVIKAYPDGRLKGFNSDFFGFKQSLADWLGGYHPGQALVLGTGGAAKAVCAVLDSLAIAYRSVSRNPGGGVLTYADLKADPSIVSRTPLLVNTTPLGMAPKTDACPGLDYEQVTPNHYLYDLVYNPTTTLFMQKGSARGAKTKGGLEMLHLQAEKSWDIWHSDE